MVFWKRELRELEASGHRFEDIFRIFSTEFTDTPFSLQFTAGQTQRMSYAELTALTNRLARVLHAHFAGQEGAFLAIRMENSPLWVAAFFGTLMAGFRPLLLNLRLDDATLAPVEQLAAGVLTDRPRADSVDLSAAGDAAGFTPVWADEIALMTSGTTGTPKLVLYDGAAITAQLLQSESIVRKCPEVKHDRLARELRMLAFLPFYHIFGLMASLLWFIFFAPEVRIFSDSADKKMQSQKRETAFLGRIVEVSMACCVFADRFLAIRPWRWQPHGRRQWLPRTAPWRSWPRCCQCCCRTSSQNRRP